MFDCEICRLTFKSHKLLDQHLNSPKHEEMSFRAEDRLQKYEHNMEKQEFIQEAFERTQGIVTRFVEEMFNLVNSGKPKPRPAPKEPSSLSGVTFLKLRIYAN